MELSSGVIERILEEWPVARLATLDRAGAPRQVPLVFVVRAGSLWSPVDGKPKGSAALARLAHVERDPRVSLLLDHWDPDWRRLWWLRLGGHAQVLRDGEAAENSLVARALRAKYPQYTALPLFHGPPTLLRVEIEERSSWCPGPAALAELEALTDAGASGARPR